jgi:hypothetical protein
MAVDRKTPTQANYGSPNISGPDYTVAVNEEVEALWANATVWLDNVTGTDTITAEADPPLLAYGRGNQYNLIPANTNTGPATIEIDGLTSRSIRDIDGVALTGGELVAGRLLKLQDDGTNLRIMNRPPEVASQNVASIATQVFTTTTTYTPNALTIFIHARLQGPGGGGGGGDSSAGVLLKSGGGGGAGEYAEGYFDIATIGASQAVTMGAVGAAGTNAGGDGGTGGTSSLGSLLTALGGVGGTGTGSNSSTAGPRAGGAGGNGGTGGHLRIPGGAGFPGYGMLEDGAAESAGWRGYGGSGHLGSTNAVNMTRTGGGGSTSAAGVAGVNYGSGGTGGISNSTTGQAAGAGGPPILIITEYLRAP